MVNDDVHGAASIAAVGVAVTVADINAGPEVCVGLWSVVLVSIASPRDIWQIARKVAGLEEG